MATATRDETQSVVELRPFRWTTSQYYAMEDMGWFRGTQVELLDGEVWERHPQGITEPRPFLWTVEQYEDMAEMGWFDEVRTELLDGEIIQMSPLGGRHSFIVNIIRMELERAFGPGYWARIQMALRFPSRRSEPEPDVAILAGSVFDYEYDNPGTAVLVVEVADTTLNTDRRRKAAIYAAAGIQEYWIANLRHDELEVYRGLVLDERGPRYSEKQILTRQDEISPLARPDIRIKVADLITEKRGM